MYLLTVTFLASAASRFSAFGAEATTCTGLAALPDLTERLVADLAATMVADLGEKVDAAVDTERALVDLVGETEEGTDVVECRYCN